MPQVFTLYLEMMRTGLYDVVFCFVFCFVFWEGFGFFFAPFEVGQTCGVYWLKSNAPCVGFSYTVCIVVAHTHTRTHVRAHMHVHAETHFPQLSP